MGRAPKTAVLVACAALLLAAAPATAKKKAKSKPAFGPVVTVTAVGNSVNAGQGISNATATCPAGTVAVGGGFSAPFTGAANRMLTDQSFRISAQAWTVSGVRGAGTVAATAFAYCRASKKAIIDVTATATVPAGDGSLGTGTATCPAGTALIGGGFQATRGPAGPNFVIPRKNLSESAGAWTASAANNTGPSQTITVHAYCVAGIPTPALLSATTTQPATQFAPILANSPSCPVPAVKKKKGGKASAAKKKKKKKPVRKLLSAGGFSVPNGSVTTPIPIVSDTRINTSVWATTGIPISAPAGTVPVTSQGICF